MPKLKHPDSRKQIDVAPEQVPMYASQGWREVATTTTTKTTAPRRKRGAAK